MTEHTKEPWKHTPGTYVTDDHGIAVCRVDFGCRTGAEATANMRRIVECVNAMAGIDNPQEWVDNARFYSHETVSAIVRERDELLEAVTDIHKWLSEFTSTDSDPVAYGHYLGLGHLIAKHRQPEEAPELFPGTLEKLRGLGK